ncbi:CPBP family glutamic-type intramembrane protease [Pedobacter nutrimenti]|uniref:CAAX prenyl protease-like protein n=1 Tax=Pedobacter nutrimenti TaxID=1241337 RepID=A0A318US55_9SPHI|nr:CPBP family glutamic-type intramembrane protease [Pedobacter nutrimenti]PYF74399.1 CAAX prenyl protease-like protein [Pedobacter nutrimenti]
MMETFSAFWQFLKRPDLLHLQKPKNTILKDFLYLSLASFIFGALVTSIKSVLVKYKLIEDYEFHFDLFEKGVFFALILAGIIAPLLEEYLFRYQLRKWKLAVYFMILLPGVIGASFIDSENIKFVVYILFLILAIFVHVKTEKMSRKTIYSFWRKFYGIHFYCTAVLFGMAHLSNWKGMNLKNPFFIIFILSQTFTGLCLGYIRVKYGIKYSILFHACFNTVLVLLASVSKLG